MNLPNFRQLRPFFLFCVIAAFLTPVLATQDDVYAFRIESEGVAYVDIRASESGDVYRVFLDIPEEPAPEGGFPVLYLLDGNWYFEIARATSELLTAVGDMPPTVIAGIGYPDGDEARFRRVRDFTGEAEHAIPEPMAEWNIQPGGRDAFTSFLLDDLPAVVADRVPVNPHCKALIGHSLGGLFALDLLFRRAGAFNDFAIGDASVWWDRYAVMDGAPAFLEDPLRELEGALFFALSTAGEFAYLDRFAAFAEHVDSRTGGAGRVTIKSYHLDTHNSMMAGFLSTSMTRLPSCARKDSG